MLPSQYLAIKAAMLREAAQRGILPRSEARTMFRLDASRALKVCIAFFMATMYQDPCMSVLMYVLDGRLRLQALSWSIYDCDSHHCAGL